MAIQYETNRVTDTAPKVGEATKISDNCMQYFHFIHLYMAMLCRE